MLFIGIFVFLNFFQPIETEDIWWHLKTGEWIVTHLQVPHQDLFPFGHEKTPWIFTQWLGSSFLYLIDKLFGLGGLKIFRALFFVGTILIFFQYAIKKVRLPIVVVLTLLLLPALYLRSNLRPDIFNYIFIQIFLIRLFCFQESNKKRSVFLLPILGIVWSNLHLGSFVYGDLLIGVFLISNACSFISMKIKRLDGFQPFGDRTKVLIGVLFCYAASFLVSPYGYEALVYPFKVFINPDYIHFYSSFDTLDEMTQPLKFFQYHQWYAGFWIIILSFLALFFLLRKSNKSNRGLHLLLFLVSFSMFLCGVRAGAFFGLVASYVIVESLKNTQDLRLGALNKVQQCFWAIIIVVMTLKGLFLYNQGVFKNGCYVKNISLDVDVANPQSALRWMEHNGIKGQIYNSDLYGGYIIWNAYPQVRPFIDGRNIVRFGQYYQTYQEPKKYWAQTDSQFNFKAILLDARDEHSFSLIKCLNKKDWQLVFHDDASIVFVKRDKREAS